MSDMPSSAPLVTVVTPVYNGADHLEECIQSVLSQTYSNWEYIIVNNCSTDRSLEIAQSYASRDTRIRIHNNAQHLGIIENHNLAFSLLPSRAHYLKPLFADDWLLPDCIEKMVTLAEGQPSVGLVGAYGHSGDEVLWQGLPFHQSCVPGGDVCKMHLLGSSYFLGTATALLFRADLVRRRNPTFFGDGHIHSDLTAFFDLLGESDFGFVHQILSYSRKPNNSNSTFAVDYGTYRLGTIAGLLKYGPQYLSDEELKARLNFQWGHYYRNMAKSILRLREKAFWEYHHRWLASLGLSLSSSRLFWETVRELGHRLAHPRDSLDGIRSWWPQAVGKHSRKMQTATSKSVSIEQGKGNT